MILTLVPSLSGAFNASGAFACGVCTLSFVAGDVFPLEGAAKAP
ncbi:hypothetical protein CSC17_1650 [Klebsiella oxytoca]|nr:hypothetical protein CSC17_1650 [Klebsiella oxytoca]